ncbi:MULTISPECIES: hypothetical protein [unclassified Amycolatopsis]|uniref:hypothetical protein n=1 Tax=unclassified Amycolatopsis TaxID=2618356 RepID=UPI0021075D16|nr:hypothetical protein [Amycolatopsis sp. DSM 110486]
MHAHPRVGGLVLFTGGYLSPVEVDGPVTVGGGSTTGTGKAVALTTGLPLVCVPTTYEGRRR